MSQRRWVQDAPDHWTAKAKGKPTLTVWQDGIGWRWEYWGDPGSDEPTVSAPGLSFENAKQCAEEWWEWRCPCKHPLTASTPICI